MNKDLKSESGVEVSVTTHYLKQKSDPLKNTHAFTYTVTISNSRSEPVRLLSRHWIITDQNNHIEEVKGKGVIGQQPLIKPSESFQYTSGTVIRSEIGDMRGSYTMQDSNGDTFEVAIPLFVLANPEMIH